MSQVDAITINTHSEESRLRERVRELEAENAKLRLDIRFVVQKAERLLTALAIGEDELGHSVSHAVNALANAVVLAKAPPSEPVASQEEPNGL